MASSPQHTPAPSKRTGTWPAPWLRRPLPTNQPRARSSTGNLPRAKGMAWRGRAALILHRRGARGQLGDGCGHTAAATGAWELGDPRPRELRPFPRQGSRLQLKTGRDQARPRLARGWKRGSGANRTENQRVSKARRCRSSPAGAPRQPPAAVGAAAPSPRGVPGSSLGINIHSERFQFLMPRSAETGPSRSRCCSGADKAPLHC